MDIGERFIIGVDPATAKGKRKAIALVHFAPAQQPTVIHWCDEHITEAPIQERVNGFLNAVSDVIEWAKTHIGQVDLVAVEDAWARGRGGANLQYLVQAIVALAEQCGIRAHRVSPSTVKKDATGSGRASAPEVSATVRMEYKGFEEIPAEQAGDLEAAAAVSGAGFRWLQETLLTEWLRRYKKR